MKTHFRAVWLSDIHLGTKDCRAEDLLDFLSHVKCEHLYLVGDIIDLWSMRRKWYWPQTHTQVIRKILKRDLKGTHITFIPGNHDEAFRDYDGMRFGNVEIRNEVVHVTSRGQRILVLHGDEFDAVTTNHRLITKVGDWLYYVLLAVNRRYNTLRRRFGLPYRSLAGYVKDKVKTALQFVYNYENYVAKAAKERDVDAIICGHIHRPEVRQIGSVLYCNCGDWVENCTAIVETLEGRIELVRLADFRRKFEEARASGVWTDADAEVKAEAAPAPAVVTVGAPAEQESASEEAVREVTNERELRQTVLEEVLVGLGDRT